MPELDGSNLRISSASRAIEIIRAQLDGATGIKSRLNVSCLLGIDAILADAIDGKLPQQNLPCIRIVFQTSEDEMASNAGVILYRKIQVSLFFLYYLGQRSGTVLPTKFTDLRDRHINDNLDYLKLKGSDGNPNGTGLTKEQFKDDAGNTFWWWPDGEQTVRREHETPFDVLGIAAPVNPSSGMACSRVDFQIMVKNHATFMNLSNFISAEIPTGTIDGTNTAFALARNVSNDINGNPSIIFVSLNGQVISGYMATVGSNVLTFTTAPQVGDIIRVTYYAQ